MGTAVGNRLYALAGWRASGSASVGFVVLAFLVCALRGPREEGWIGWSGGWGIRRRDLGGDTKKKVANNEPGVEQVLDELAAENQDEGDKVVVEDDKSKS